jgi:hypothetical protein
VVALIFYQCDWFSLAEIKLETKTIKSNFSKKTLSPHFAKMSEKTRPSSLSTKAIDSWRRTKDLEHGDAVVINLVAPQRPGLPDFSWYRIPKWGKNTKLP